KRTRCSRRFSRPECRRRHNLTSSRRRYRPCRQHTNRAGKLLSRARSVSAESSSEIQLRQRRRQTCRLRTRKRNSQPLLSPVVVRGFGNSIRAGRVQIVFGGVFLSRKA